VAERHSLNRLFLRKSLPFLCRERLKKQKKRKEGFLVIFSARTTDRSVKNLQERLNFFHRGADWYGLKI
jgi:hypothetical protein